MASFTKNVRNQKSERNFERSGAEINHMGGISYTPNALDVLKMVTASSIFGEPQYYRSNVKDGSYKVNGLFREYTIIPNKYEGMNTSAVMEKVIDDALDYDFGAVLDWAVELRKDFFMRTNPQVIMVRASLHSGRQAFTDKHPNKFAEVEAQVMSRADEPAVQLSYYLFKKGSKKNLPSILKRAWSRRIQKMTRYEVSKYKSAETGLIDVVRIAHSGGNAVIDELMRTGSVEITSDEENRWERMKSEGKTWTEILNTIKLPHMALLRNLRGIFGEIKDTQKASEVMKWLEAGVKNGRQFPFRYYTAMQALQKEAGVNHKQILIDGLEGCIDAAAKEMPKLKGRTMCLSDNSGSAWNAFNSEYGSVTVAEIDNLSSVITAANSDEGYVGAFGDRLMVTPISKRNGILGQATEISKNARGRYNGGGVGGGTENGVWIFFRDAIDKGEHWDNIFIYSDQQAGHGGLYGDDRGTREYTSRGFSVSSGGYGRSNYVDVAKLINEYRHKVNPKVNVFSVQTAGYTNVVLPETAWRTGLLYGWTGKELNYASKMIDIFDSVETRNKN